MPAAKISCTVCRRSNNPWRKFCGGCGTAFAGACKCGCVNAPEDRFCGGCGGAVRSTARMKQFAESENVTMKIALEELMPAEKS
jgi:hypothetical protein